MNFLNLQMADAPISQSFDSTNNLIKDMFGELEPFEMAVPGDMFSMTVGPPTPQPPTTTNVRPTEQPTKMKKKKSKAKPIAVPALDSVACTPPQPTIIWTNLGDPKDYVLDIFDRLIGPGITGATPTLALLRQHVFRRAVGDLAYLDLRERMKTGILTVDDILDVTVTACRNVGIVL